MDGSLPVLPILVVITVPAESRVGKSRSLMGHAVSLARR